MKASLRRVRDFRAMGRSVHVECGRGFRFRTVVKNADGSRQIECSYCEIRAKIRAQGRVDFAAIAKGIKARVLSFGPLRRVKSFNNRWRSEVRRAA